MSYQFIITQFPALAFIFSIQFYALLEIYQNTFGGEKKNVAQDTRLQPISEFPTCHFESLTFPFIFALILLRI